MVSKVSDLYFSRVVLASPPRDPYAVHQALWKAFKSEERPFLFRADAVREAGKTRLKVLVQAELEADWSALGEGLAEVEQKRRAVRLTAGEQLRFFLRANPTVSRKGRNEPAFAGVGGSEFRERRGVRVGLVREEDQLRWLERKLGAAGAKAIGVRAHNARPWHWGRRELRAKHDGVDFEGALLVEDPGRLCEAVAAGIGAGKAFGFGLLSLARHPE